ncbi:hypothetical protein Trydic_g1468 [Trypoxylus dichotomus]
MDTEVRGQTSNGATKDVKIRGKSGERVLVWQSSQKCSIHRTLRKNFHPYKLQLVQDLMPTDAAATASFQHSVFR